jgi:hypothetical protein
MVDFFAKTITIHHGEASSTLLAVSSQQACFLFYSSITSITLKVKAYRCIEYRLGLSTLGQAHQIRTHRGEYRGIIEYGPDLGQQLNGSHVSL